MIRFWASRKGMAEIVGAALLIMFLAIQIMPAVKNVSINSDKLIAAVDTKIKGQLTSRNNYSIPVHGTDFILMEDTQADWQAGTLTNMVATSAGDLKLQTAESLIFTRNSVAYKSDGTQIAAGTPRFESGKFGQAIMTEEGTTNYVGNPSFETDTTGWVLGPAFARSNATALFGSYSIALSNPAGAQEAYYSIAVSPNTTYTISCYVKNGLNVNVRMDVAQFNSTGAIIRQDVDTVFTSPSSVWVRLVKTVTTLSNAANVRIRLITDVAGTGTAYWDGVQMEKKGYATSFIDGTRAGELVSTALADIINPKEGTIEFWLKPLNLAGNMYVGVGGSRFISSGEDNSSYNIWHDSSDGGLHTSYGYGTGLYGTGSYNMQVGNWYYIAATWKENDSIKLYVNGALHSTAPIGTLGTSSVFKYQTLFLGQSSLGGWFANALFDELRISNKARSANEISAAYSNSSGLNIDEYTTYKCSFDGNLLAGRGGTRISPVYDISQVKIAGDSSISWAATTPSGTSVVIESNLSLDGGGTWLGWKQCTNGGQIPDITPGMDLSNARLQIREKLTTSDVTVTPSLSSVTINITAQ